MGISTPSREEGRDQLASLPPVPLANLASRKSGQEALTLLAKLWLSRLENTVLAGKSNERTLIAGHCDHLKRFTTFIYRNGSDGSIVPRAAN